MMPELFLPGKVAVGSGEELRGTSEASRTYVGPVLGQPQLALAWPQSLPVARCGACTTAHCRLSWQWQRPEKRWGGVAWRRGMEVVAGGDVHAAAKRW
jgi:hypothetical protein